MRLGLILCSLASIGIISVDSSRCLPGWQGRTGDNNCYLFKTTPKSWDDAQAYCQGLKASLVRIESQDKKAWMSSAIHRMKESDMLYLWWVGVSRPPGKQSAWKWTDGLPINSTLSLWINGYPHLEASDGLTDRLCGDYQFQSSEGLADKDCALQKPFICQRSMDVPSFCDSDNGWIGHKETCYKFFDSKRSWADARLDCENNGAILVTPLTTITQQTVTDIAGDHKAEVWIGLHSKIGPGAQVSAVTWEWADGSAFGNAFWAINQPTVLNTQKNDSCATTRPGDDATSTWTVRWCQGERNYICQKPERSCDPGWKSFGKSCFQFNLKTILSWDHAVESCQNQGTKLLQITNQQIQTFVNSYLVQLRLANIDQIWIGLNDPTGNGQFAWSDKTTPVTYTNFAEPKPVPNGARSCQYISAGGSQGKWISGPCLSVRPFLCQTESNKPVSEVTTPSPRYVCPPDWIQTNGQSQNCFSFHDVRVTWTEARQSCHAMNGDLARITTQEDLSLINEHLTSSKWIGLNDLTTEGKLVWLDDKDQPDFFYLSSPSRKDTKMNCAYANGAPGNTLGRWEVTDCNATHGYICEKPAVNVLPGRPTLVPSTTSAPWTAGCGPGWEQHSDSCYMFRDEQKDWGMARSVCQHNGGDLVSIINAVEQSFLTGRMRSLKSSFFWTGARDQRVEGGWTWSDATPMAFINWDAGQPDNSGQSDCGAIKSPQGVWDDLRCNSQNGFICEKKATGTSTTRLSTTSTHMLTGNSMVLLGCPRGWYVFSGHCYMIKQSSVTWSEAQRACQQDNSNLVSIRGGTEQLFVFSRVQSVTGPVWIGLNSLQRQREFEWSDRQSVTYIHWARGEPDNPVGGSRNCVAMNNNGEGYWSDETCDLPTVAGYVCKKEISPVSTGTPHNIRGCSHGWVGYEAKCYRFVDNPMTFNDAEGFCKSSFGHLAVVNDRYVQAFLSGELAARSGTYWIGLQTYYSGSTYSYWTDMTRVRFTNWDRSHTGRETHSCVLIKADQPVGLWLNLACTEKKQFICEMNRIVPSTTPVTFPSTTPAPSCPTNYHEYDGDCYRLYTHSQKYTWYEAIQICARDRSGILSVHNTTQVKWIRETLIRYSSYRRTYWLGLNIIDQSKGYNWLDGSPNDFTLWASGQPDNHNDQEECVEWDTRANSWRDNNCHVRNGVICQQKKGTVQSPPASPSVTAAPTVTCPISRYWKYFNGSCYYIRKSYLLMNWFDARDYCRMTVGGDLMSIGSQPENDFLLESISLNGGSLYWTGFNELELNGDRWSDGSPVVYTNWAINEPNDDFGGQKCVTVHNGDGNWYDGNCAERYPFVCKQVNGTKSSSVVTPTPQVKGYCPHGWSGLGNKCYKVFGGTNTSSEKVNWTSASTACQAKGNTYNLVTIRDQVEQLSVTSLLYERNGSFWIGLNALLGYKKYLWADNSPVSFTNWDTGEPNNYPYREDRKHSCVEIRTKTVGKWADNFCATTQGYICQTLKDSSLPEPQTQPPPSWCKTGYSVFGSSCYTVKRTNHSWDEALQSCQADGANLASFNDQYEFSFVRILTYGMTDTLWIGLSDSQLKGIYRWSDGWPLLYTNWGQGEPSRSEGEGCVGLNSDGTWTDTACNNTYRAICEIKLGTPPPYTTPVPGYCQNSAWIQFEGRCYEAHTNSLSWSDAQFKCKQNSMSLATIHGQKEADFLKKLSTEKRFRYTYWIGMVNAFNAGYKWTDGSPEDYTNWDKNEPSTFRDNSGEACVEVVQNTNKWNDNTCSNKRQYICVTKMVMPTPSTKVSTGGSTTRTGDARTTLSIKGSSGKVTTTVSTISSSEGTAKTVSPNQAPNSPLTSEPTTPGTSRAPSTSPTKTSSVLTRTETTDISRGTVTGKPKTKPEKPTSAQIDSSSSRIAGPTRLNPHPAMTSPSSAAFKDHQTNNGKTSLSPGAVTGISLGVVLVVFIVIVALVVSRRRGMLRLGDHKQSLMFDNALYNPTTASTNNST